MINKKHFEKRAQELLDPDPDSANGTNPASVAL
jgi:glycine cleavage system protein P-like pyridoxal-binding family